MKILPMVAEILPKRNVAVQEIPLNYWLSRCKVASFVVCW
jgi:hypothetical protein